MRKYCTLIVAFLGLCPVVLSAKTDWRLRSPAQIAAGDLVFRYLGASFDNEFDASNDSKIYCSELIMLSINAAAGKTLITPTRRGQHEIIGLDDIYLTGFKKIYDSKLSTSNVQN